MSRLFDLTSKQQKAFDELKKAYKKCLRENIYFINNYGSLQAVDKRLINDYSDDRECCNSENEVSTDEIGESLNSFSIANEWSDDKHYYGLTKEGWEVYKNG